ncbi:AraC family transcriptional regulator [Paractinoplanes toevensis]|uniref:AraC family transcriptional regulator n=1 Tax=Paractinoplanes toevensis TaxID=571911 RepID=A0A919T3H0_9ACTN|nr:AraC family transcriptional regulator [Actinoplanes toevensis]GIM88674.1 AraC family transcriptional regulator [Actinoplanes toevensis]
MRFTVDPGTRALLHDLGISVAGVLRRARLPAGLFAPGPVTLTVEEYYHFWAAIDAEAADPDLPARIGRTISVEAFNPPLFAALCSADLRTAAERIAVFKPLIGPVVLEVTAGRRGLTIAYRWPEWPVPPRLLVAAELAFWVALARIGTRREMHATHATMRDAPAESATMTAYLGTSIDAGDLDAITFSAEDAARPFLTEDESMWDFFAPELRRRLAEIEASATTADRVRAALHECLPAGDSSINAVATQLIMSPRTLQRQLQAEGTSYQAVLTGTREELARRYLADRSLTVSQIAYLLAYDDTNSFYRAFRNWTGVTPETAR